MNHRVLRHALRAILLIVPVALLAGFIGPQVVEAALRPTPTGVHQVAATTSSMTLAWRHVSGSPAYQVSYGTSPTGQHARTAVFHDNRGTISGLRPGHRYFVRVAASDRHGAPISNFTQTAPAVRTLYPGGYRFLAPSQVQVVKARLRSLKLDWRPVTDAPGYRVQVSPTPAMLSARTHWFADDRGEVTDLKPGTTYYVTVSVAPGAESAEPLSGSTVARPIETEALVPKSYDLRVASYNISGTLNDTRRNAPWAVRKSYVAHQLLGLSPADQKSPPPDAIALQEANTSRRLAGGVTQYYDLLNALNASAPESAHYSSVGGNSNATRIAWNDKTLDLVSSGVLAFRAQEMRADGARMAPWAIFEVKQTHARFFFLSAHLETSSERVRRAQWNELIARTPSLSQGLPVVMGGDFNSPRKSRNNPTAASMLGPMKAAGFGDTLGQTGTGMVTTATSRAEAVVNGNYNSVNRFSRTLNWYPSSSLIGQDVDYLFASNALVVKKWEMVLDVAGRTLRGVVPSDHNMIRSELVLPTP